MHALALILAAEDKTNIGYTVAGILFTVWAIVVSLIGLRKHDFPKTKAQGQIASLVSVVLAAATLGLLIVVSV